MTIIEREVRGDEAPSIGIRRVASSGETLFSNRYFYDAVLLTGALANSIVEDVTVDVARLFASRRDAREAVRAELYLPPISPRSRLQRSTEGAVLECAAKPFPEGLWWSGA